ncbi:hypothetical protein BC827DRAFT_1223359, partial [Russula dissimulans]
KSGARCGTVREETTTEPRASQRTRRHRGRARSYFPGWSSMARWRVVRVANQSGRASRRSRGCRTHAKVVALLKVPFPLLYIIVDRLQMCWRAVTAQGIARPSWNTEAESDRLVPTAAGRSRTSCL